MSQPASTPFSVFSTPEAVKAAAGTPFDLKLGVKVEKVDKAKRTITGVATAEVLDVHGQIVVYDAAKAAMATWKGNVREMHQPKAVGKAVDVEFDDANKCIRVTSYISKGAEDTWQKILDGTLGEYSIGARATVTTDKVDGQPVEKLHLTRMNELSVVDAGACPGCAFDMVKMVGETPTLTQDISAEEAAALEQPAAEPAPAAETPTPAETAKAATRADVLALLQVPRVDRFTKATALLVTVEADVAKRIESYDIRCALQAIGCLEEIIASEYWEARDADAPSAEQLAQVDMLRDAAELVLAYLMAEFSSQFDDLPAAASTAVAASIDGADIGKRVARAVDAVKARVAKKTPPTAPAAEPAPIAKVETPTPAPAPEPTATEVQVQKLTGELETTKAALAEAQATTRATAETIAKLETRLATVEAQPAPGGPLSRAVPVSKAIGNTTAPDEAADPESVIRVLQEVAKAETDEGTRQRIAARIVALQMANGSSRLVIERK